MRISKMFRSPFPQRIQISWGIFLLAPSFANARAAASQLRIALPDSIKHVGIWTQAGPPDPHTPYISRNVFMATESAASVKFEVALQMRNFSELQSRIARGEHISFQEMTAKYDPPEADYQEVIEWLTSQGFTIARRHSNRLAVFASGNVSFIQKALEVTFARVSLEGIEYNSVITAPQVHAALAPLLIGINGLQPFILLHTPPILKPNSLNGAASGSAPVTYMSAQIVTAYMASGLYGSNITGLGQAIAILMDDLPKTSDLTSFWAACGISQSLSNITLIHVVSGRLDSSDQEEATLHTEWSSALVPGANVRVYTFSILSNTDIDEALDQIYADAQTYPIHQLSLSFGSGEASQTLSDVSTFDQSIATLAGAGVTVFAFSGDGGLTPSDTNGTDPESGTTLTVEWPASNPNVTGVGGTLLVLNSGNSVDTEVVWNENIVDGYTSSGGGLSTFYNRPSWQTGTGVPSGTMRYVPDVAAAADPAATPENDGVSNLLKYLFTNLDDGESSQCFPASPHRFDHGRSDHGIGVIVNNSTKQFIRLNVGAQ